MSDTRILTIPYSYRLDYRAPSQRRDSTVHLRADLVLGVSSVTSDVAPVCILIERPDGTCAAYRHRDGRLYARLTDYAGNPIGVEVFQEDLAAAPSAWRPLLVPDAASPRWSPGLLPLPSDGAPGSDPINPLGLDRFDDFAKSTWPGRARKRVIGDDRAAAESAARAFYGQAIIVVDGFVWADRTEHAPRLRVQHDRLRGAVSIRLDFGSEPNGLAQHFRIDRLADARDYAAAVGDGVFTDLEESVSVSIGAPLAHRHDDFIARAAARDVVVAASSRDDDVQLHDLVDQALRVRAGADSFGTRRFLEACEASAALDPVLSEALSPTLRRWRGTACSLPEPTRSAR